MDFIYTTLVGLLCLSALIAAIAWLGVWIVFIPLVGGVAFMLGDVVLDVIYEMRKG